MKPITPTIARLAVCLSLLPGLAAAADRDARHAAACAPAAEHQLTHFQQLADARGHTLSVVGDLRCAGGPDLQDRATAAQPVRRVKLVTGWWLHDFISARWLDAARTELQVRARYITGAGPRGSAPFSVEINARRVGDAWQVDEPQVVDADFDLPTEQADGLIRVESVGQSENLRLAYGRRPDVSAIDFTRQRLILRPQFFGSASIHVTDQWVREDAAGYVVGFATNAPRIGVAKPLRTVLSWVLPNDGKPVRFAGRQDRKKKGLLRPGAGD